MKTLVVFYSRKGSTERIARGIAAELEADTLWLDTVYDLFGTGGFCQALGSSVFNRELLLFPYDEQVSDYDRVIICTPIWAGKVCRPVLEFCRKERHNVMAADYVFVSATGKVNADRLADSLDRLLRLEHGSVRVFRSLLGRETELTADDE